MSVYPRRRVHLIIFLLSVLLLASTLWLPRKASTLAELENAQLGVPLPFVVQDLTTYDHTLPWTYTFKSPWENPTQVLWGRLLVSLLLAVLLLELLAFFFLRPRPARRKRERAQT